MRQNRTSTTGHWGQQLRVLFLTPSTRPHGAVHSSWLASSRASHCFHNKPTFTKLLQRHKEAMTLQVQNFPDNSGARCSSCALRVQNNGASGPCERGMTTTGSDHRRGKSRRTHANVGRAGVPAPQLMTRCTTCRFEDSYCGNSNSAEAKPGIAIPFASVPIVSICTSSCPPPIWPLSNLPRAEVRNADPGDRSARD
jgi:hypothetical protein